MSYVKTTNGEWKSSIIWVLLLVVGFAVCIFPAGVLGDERFPPAWGSVDLDRIEDILEDPPGDFPTKETLFSYFYSGSQRLEWKWDRVQAEVDRVANHMSKSDPDTLIYRSSAMVLTHILMELRKSLPQELCVSLDELEIDYPVLELIHQIQEQVLILVDAHPEDPAVFTAVLLATALRVEGHWWCAGIDKHLASVSPHPAWYRIWVDYLGELQEGNSDHLMELAVYERVYAAFSHKQVSEEEQPDTKYRPSGQLPKRRGKELGGRIKDCLETSLSESGRYPDRIFDSEGQPVEWLLAALEDISCLLAGTPGFRLSNYEVLDSGYSFELTGSDFLYQRTFTAP